MMVSTMADTTDQVNVHDFFVNFLKECDIIVVHHVRDTSSNWC